MNLRIVRALRAAGLFLILAWPGDLLAAAGVFPPPENGRDFGGQYAVSNVVESDGTVSAMLTVRVMNHSGRDIQGARLLLHAGAPETVLAENVGFANHAPKVVRAKITIPAGEFARWQRRGPALAIEWPDADGTMARRTVELIRVPAIAEEK